MRVWRSSELRPTMDIDMLGKMSNEAVGIVALMKDIMAVEVEADGLMFDPDSIQSEGISGDMEYEGVRVRFRGHLDTARVVIQVDIGFGDIVYPAPEETCLPTVLNHPSPKLLCYSRESAIAEKFEAMIKLGIVNSRMKDFHDIWLLSRQFDFSSNTLAEAIRLTMERRGTLLPLDIEAFGKAFQNEKQIQWTAFRNRLQQNHIPIEFADIVSGVKAFLAPVISTTQVKARNTRWIAPGPWT